MKKKYTLSLFSGCLIGVVLFLILINAAKPRAGYDFPFYHDLEGMVQKANQIVIGNVVADEGIKMLDVGGGNTEYRIYRIKISEAISGDAAAGEEILVRVFKRNDSDDHPFEVGKDYVCFLWKGSDCPATPLNRSQVAIRLEGEELLMTKDAYTAVKGTTDRLRSGSEAVVQNNENTDDYEDIILKGGRSEILSMIREMAAEKE